MRNDRSIDDLDRAIIAELERDARLSNLELARRVGLTPAPCLRRVQKLEQAGIIEGYHAKVNPKASGRGFEVVVAIDIAVNDGKAIEDFEAAAVAVPEVTEMRRMFGQPDYYLRVQVATPEAYERLSVSTLSRLPAVSRLLSHQTMRHLKGRPPPAAPKLSEDRQYIQPEEHEVRSPVHRRALSTQERCEGRHEGGCQQDEVDRTFSEYNGLPGEQTDR